VNHLGPAEMGEGGVEGYVHSMSGW
jgi:hypothetical protein